MSCASFEQLVDYWAGEADGAEAVEEHVFECDRCERRLAAVARLCEGVGQVTRRRGGLDLFLTTEMVERLERDGLRIRRYHAGPGDHVACEVGADDDLVVSWFTAELRPGETVDLVVDESALGPRRYVDIPVDAASGRIIHAFSAELLRRLPSCVVQVRAMVGERVAGEYHFHHTATPR